MFINECLFFIFLVQKLKHKLKAIAQNLAQGIQLRFQNHGELVDVAAMPQNLATCLRALFERFFDACCFDLNFAGAVLDHGQMVMDSFALLALQGLDESPMAAMEVSCEQVSIVVLLVIMNEIEAAVVIWWRAHPASVENDVWMK